MASDIEYLNQIAQDNRAVGQKAQKGLPIDPKWLKIIGVGILGVILIMIVGGLLGGLGTAERDLMDKIYDGVSCCDFIVNHNDGIKFYMVVPV